MSIGSSKEDDQEELVPVLHEFRVHSGSHREGSVREMESLHKIDVRKADLWLYGTLHYSTVATERRVERAQLRGIEIDYFTGFDYATNEPTRASCSDGISIPVTKAAGINHDVVFGSPEEGYRQIYEDFLWLADLTKHVLDYLMSASLQNKLVHLEDFRSDFRSRLLSWHADVPEFETWYQCCGRPTDFRRIVACAFWSCFIYKQAESLGEAFLSHPLWSEIALPIPRVIRGSDQTLVTRNVRICFEQVFPHWGKNGFGILKEVQLTPTLEKSREERRQKLRLPDKSCALQSEYVRRADGGFDSSALSLLRQATTRELCSPPWTSISDLVNLTVAVQHRPTDASSGPNSSSGFRYALVRDVYDEGRLRVVWLLLPQDTMCAGGKGVVLPPADNQMFYPVPHELFFSDECNCVPVPASDIVATFKTSVLTDSLEMGHVLLVRQKYLPGRATFVNVQATELDTPCHPLQAHTSQTKPPDQAEVFPEPSPPTIKSISLYSGCGLFDYGLEAGSNGGVDTVSALDIDTTALRSHAANYEGASKRQYYARDVNHHFQQIVSGQIPTPDADMLTCGSPCVGFSWLNPNRHGRASQLNRSLLAHALSWIDVLLPKLVLLENVPAMDQETPSACGQAVGFLVSLGYQVRKLDLKASKLGAATIRRRLFIVATVPEVSLPGEPEITHGSGYVLKEIVTAEAATADLDRIDNSLTRINPSMHDHVPLDRLTPDLVEIVEKIPTRHRADKSTSMMPNLSDAHDVLDTGQREWFEGLNQNQKTPLSRTMKRIDPDRPFQTMTTLTNVMDARFGNKLHWNQHRVISLEEVRRAQGVPPSFVLLGNPRQQLQQSANGVVWEVGHALGREIAKVWRDSHQNGTASIATAEDDTTVVVENAIDETPNRPILASEGQEDVPTVHEVVKTYPAPGPPAIRTRGTCLDPIIISDEDDGGGGGGGGTVLQEQIVKSQKRKWLHS